MVDQSRTLAELEDVQWAEPTYFSHVVTECHRLRRVPLRDLTAEDLRLLIGQDVGTRHLVPLALDDLAINPFAEGDYYPGDLLQAVFTRPAAFWREHPDLWEAANRIARPTLEHIRLRHAVVPLYTDATLTATLEEFLATMDSPSARR